VADATTLRTNFCLVDRSEGSRKRRKGEQAPETAEREGRRGVMRVPVTVRGGEKAKNGRSYALQ